MFALIRTVATSLCYFQLAQAAKAAEAQVEKAAGLAGYLPLLGEAMVRVGLPGMVGGLLYAAFTGTVQMPRCTKEGDFSPGFLVDMLYGLVGGFAVFLLLPAEFQDMDRLLPFVKMTAIAAVGGFGGRLLIKKLVAELLARKLEDVAERQEVAEKERERRDKAMNLVARQLDLSNDVKPVAAEDLIQAVAEAPHDAKVQIFYQARKARGDAWRDRSLAELAARAIPIFRGLIKSDPEKQYHRNYGQLAYALKDQPKPDKAAFDEAAKALKTAIEIRDKAEIDGFLRYEWNGAMCRIALDEGFAKGQPSAKETRDRVLADLSTAVADETIRSAIQEDLKKEDPPKGKRPPYAKWMELNLDDAAFSSLGLAKP